VDHLRPGQVFLHRLLDVRPDQCDHFPDKSLDRTLSMGDIVSNLWEDIRTGAPFAVRIRAAAQLQR
jgi:hypothetical protein